MNKEWKTFCQTTDLAHYNKAFELREELENDEGM